MNWKCQNRSAGWYRILTNWLPDWPAGWPRTQSPMWPVSGGTAPMPLSPEHPFAQYCRNVRGAWKLGRSKNSTTSRIASHGMNAAIMAGMLRRSSSPASTANPNAHRM